MTSVPSHPAFETWPFAPRWGTGPGQHRCPGRRKRRLFLTADVGVLQGPYPLVPEWLGLWVLFILLAHRPLLPIHDLPLLSGLPCLVISSPPCSVPWEARTLGMGTHSVSHSPGLRGAEVGMRPPIPAPAKPGQAAF